MESWATRSNTNLRKWLTASALVVLPMAGCSASQTVNNGSMTAATYKSTQKVVYHLGGVIQPEQATNFNPFLPTGNWGTLFDYIYNKLFYFNSVKGQLLPDLANDQGTWSEDHLNYTVKLHANVKWQDGQPLTPDDIIYSFQSLRDHPVLDRYKLWSDSRLGDVSASGDSVVFHLKKQFLSLPYYLSTVYIVPKHVFAQENPETFINSKPVGTGPFQFTSINASAIILDKNPTYFKSPASIDELMIDRFNNVSTLTLALEKGEIQATDGGIDMPSAPKLLQNPAIKMQFYPVLSVYTVLINNDKSGLKDPAVRRAIQLALDHQWLIEKGNENAGFPANPGFLPQVFGDIADASLFKDPSYNFDLTKASQILQSAGYQKNANGIYEKEGQPLTFVYYMPANQPAHNKMGTMITEWLHQVGIATTIKVATAPELTKLAMSGNYDLMDMNISFPPDPQAALEAFDSHMTAPIGQNTPGLNYMRFRDPQVDQWLATASSTSDTTQRKELYDKVQQRIAEQAPLAVMYTGSGHLPYRVDAFTNYNADVPVTSAISLSQIKSIR